MRYKGAYYTRKIRGNPKKVLKIRNTDYFNTSGHMCMANSPVWRRDMENLYFVA
jgi:hypothetical protein